jgi:hypothetical protein
VVFGSKIVRYTTDGIVDRSFENKKAILAIDYVADDRLLMGGEDHSLTMWDFATDDKALHVEKDAHGNR